MLTHHDTLLDQAILELGGPRRLSQEITQDAVTTLGQYNGSSSAGYWLRRRVELPGGIESSNLAIVVAKIFVGLQIHHP